MKLTTAAAGLVAGLLLSGSAFAQAAAPAAPAAAPAAPAMAAPKPASPKAAAMDKKAVSKMCSDDATKQGLHGKERKAFRAKCKTDKMKGMM